MSKRILGRYSNDFLRELEYAGETEDDVEWVLSTFEKDPEFGCRKILMVWTKGREYFVSENNGEIWVDSVARNPDESDDGHVGLYWAELKT